MRCFIAVDLPDEIKKEIFKEIVLPLKNRNLPVKWVEKVNLHITLKFLGEISEKDVGKIKDKLQDKIKGIGRFKINLFGLDYFGSFSNVRVIFVKIKDGEVYLKKLFEIIEDFSYKEIGIVKEKRAFSGHLTIGRVKKGKKVFWSDLSLDLKKEYIFWVDKITLFKSVLTPQGPIYTKIKEFSLI